MWRKSVAASLNEQQINKNYGMTPDLRKHSIKCASIFM
jgi:hypothetical protein